MSSGGFKGNFRDNSNGYQNRNGPNNNFRNGGDNFAGNRGNYGNNNQSFGGSGLKSVEWGVKTLRPVSKPDYVPHPAITSRSPYEVHISTVDKKIIFFFIKFLFLAEVGKR